MERLAKFPSSLVVSEVKTRLKKPSQPTEQIVRLLSILGTYGSSMDAQEVSSCFSIDSESVRNVSDETTKLLLDPLRLAEAFRELWFAM